MDLQLRPTDLIELSPAKKKPYWFWRVRARNGQILLTSELYGPTKHKNSHDGKASAKRSAKAFSKRTCIPIKELGG